MKGIHLRKVFSFLLALSLAISIAPTVSPHVYADEAQASLRIDGTPVELNGDTSEWDDNVGGWKYDKDNEWLAMLNVTANEVVATGELAIVSAGVNRIKSLNISDNTLIVGHSVMIIDQIIGDGVVTAVNTALFVKDDGGQYVLQNDAVLYEEHTLPAGTFVIPQNITLELGGKDFGEAAGQDRYSTGVMNISADATLIIQEGGVVKNFTKYEDVESEPKSYYYSMINIDGNLHIEDGAVLIGAEAGRDGGKINCTGGAVVKCKGDGRIDGGQLLLNPYSNQSDICVSGAAIRVNPYLQAGSGSKVVHNLTLFGECLMTVGDRANNRALQFGYIQVKPGSVFTIQEIVKKENRFSIDVEDGIFGGGSLKIENGIVNVLNGGVTVNQLSALGSVLCVNSDEGDPIRADSVAISHGAINVNGGSGSISSASILIENSLLYAGGNVGASYATTGAVSYITELFDFSSGGSKCYEKIVRDSEPGGENYRMYISRFLNVQDYNGEFSYGEVAAFSGDVGDYDDVEEFTDGIEAGRKVIEVYGLDSSGKVISQILQNNLPDTLESVFAFTVMNVYTSDIPHPASTEGPGSSEHTGSGVIGGSDGSAMCAAGIHSFGNWSTVSQATCNENGTRKGECIRGGCDVTTTQDTAKLKHTFGAWTTSGDTKSRKCSLCGQIESQTLPPVSSGSNGAGGQVVPEAAVITGEVTGIVKDGQAAATVPDTVIKNIIDQIASQKNIATIQINVASPGDVTTISLELPESLIAAAVAAGTGITMNTELGMIEIDAATLAALAKEMGTNASIIITIAKPQNMTDAQRDVIGDSDAYELTIMIGGKVFNQFKGNVTVTLNHQLEQGQHYSGVEIKHVDKDGKTTTLKHKHKDGKYTFETNHFSIFAVFYDENIVWINPFTDVSDNDWFFEAVRYVNKERLFNGISETKFSPNEPMTRAMFATVLYRLADMPELTEGAISFGDITDGEWYTDAVSWAATAEIAFGDGKGRFNPGGQITREEMVAMFYRYAKHAGYEVTEVNMKSLDVFSDKANIGDWAVTSMAWAAERGIIHGDGNGAVLPGDTSKRSQVAQVMLNAALLKPVP